MKCTSLEFLLKPVRIFTLVLLFALFPVHLLAQDSKTFNSPQSEGGKVEACESITLSPGFSFKATTGQSMTFSINRSVCSPRQEQISLGSDKNYILKITPLDASSHVEVTNGQLSIDRDSRALVDIQYFDGLGRPVQTVQRGITPSRQDLVSFQTYDAFGRDSEQWLPVPHPGNGSYIPPAAAMTAAVDFYEDQNPFSKPVYEASPLGRVNEQYGPGQAWHNNSKAIKTTFLINTSTGELSCALYKLTGRDESPTLTRAGNYPEGQLYITRLRDEDGNTSYEFKDKLGQVVLARQINENLSHDTYYIYDVFGNLTYVLPPEASDRLMATGTIWDESNDILQKYAYLYRYDHRNRPVAKRLPGTDWIYSVYDKADRLILSQDGEQRKKSEWSFSKYDALGRAILAGAYTDTTSHKSLCTQYWDIVVKESPGIDNYGYSWNTPPVVTYDKVLTVNYYDDYEHLLNQKQYFRDSLNYMEKEGYGKRHTDSNCTNCSSKGLLTGIRIKMLDGSGEIVSALYYDDKGRIIQKKSTNHLGGFDNEYYAYTFTGQPTKKLSEHSMPGKPALTELYTYSYDHAGRQINTWHQINDQPEVLLSELSYNELGQLQHKSLGALEEIDYTYNIRGWMKSIENPRFSEYLYYEAPEQGTPRFNGNISQINYQKDYYHTFDTYIYNYDGLNRLKESIYTSGGLMAPGGYNEYFTYDKHGNIQSLLRRGASVNTPYNGNHFSVVNDLQFSYEGNRLKNIENTSPSYNFYHSPYFKDQYHGETEYVYDANGNVTQDYNKEIAKIEYNCLHLPQRLQLTSGHTIDYSYDASGVKRRVVSRTATQGMNIPMGTIQPLEDQQVAFTERQDYVNNIIYKDNGNTISRVLISEGYLIPTTSGQMKYIFQMKDHLGSIQHEINETGETIGNMNYYASGTSMVRGDIHMESPYRFSGKEFQEMHGLNLYDFLARTYDPSIMRFTTMDPLAEKYYSVSPYVYCSNNPVNRIDPTGMKDTTFVEGKDKPITKQPGTATPIHNPDGSVSSKAKDAYNCHSYAWDNSQGDPSDPANQYPVSIGATKWDNDPSNNMGGYAQLKTNDSNKKGDKVIYFSDSNGNGKYDSGENIEHSAVVQTVDANGNTTTVIGKMGQDGISENHPTAPGYYSTDANGDATSRAYFRSTTTSSTSASTGASPSFSVVITPQKSYVAERNATYVAPRIVPIFPVKR